MRSKATDWAVATGLLASLVLGAPSTAQTVADSGEGPVAREVRGGVGFTPAEPGGEPERVRNSSPSLDEASGAPARLGKLQWKDGVTSFETEDFRIALSNRVQFRFTDLIPDSRERLAGTAEAGDSLASFRIRRAKTQMEGWFWKRELSFEVQIGWAGSDSTGGSSVFSGLEDARLTWDVGGSGRFQVKIGQYKVPFGRQEMTSSERQQFVDRSILSGEFTHSRDVGLSLEGALAGGKLAYQAGVFNGNGRNKATNDNAAFQYDARLVFQPWGDVKYSEGDFDSKGHPLLALAAEFEQNDLSHSTNTNNFKNTILGGDLVFKFKGFSLFAEHFWRTRAPERGDSFRSDGYHVQAGYFLVRDHLELAFRYAAWDPSDQVSGDTQSEVGVAVTYYVLKHHLKIGGDFRQIQDQSRDTKDKELRLQTQFVF